MADGGFHPFRHNCGVAGENCHVKYHKLTIENFAKHLPGNCGFTDIDGVFERRSRFLFLEWKGWRGPAELPLGQHLFFVNLTALNPRIWAIVGFGNPTTAEAHHWREIHNGKCSPWITCTPQGFGRRLEEFGRAFHRDRDPPPLIPQGLLETHRHG